MMTKNSRRKQAARQRAARTGESYTRARRATDPSSQEPPPDAVEGTTSSELDEIPEDFEDIHRIQRLVESRGWIVGPYCADDLDDDGLATILDVQWEYPAAFGGTQYDDDGDDAPCRPTCGFSWEAGSDIQWITVDTAGNWKGCATHSTIRRTLPLTEAGIGRLPQLLAEIEEHARSMDLAPLIKCSASGPCAELIAQRDEEQKRHLVWLEAQIDAYDTVLTEQQRAEFHAWEKANTDGHSVSTADWPGWIPLIGEPPWRAKAQNQQPQLGRALD
jgi:hypothetical protein